MFETLIQHPYALILGVYVGLLYAFGLRDGYREEVDRYRQWLRDLEWSQLPQRERERQELLEALQGYAVRTSGDSPEDRLRASLGVPGVYSGLAMSLYEDALEDEEREYRELYRQ